MKGFDRTRRRHPSRSVVRQAEPDESMGMPLLRLRVFPTPLPDVLRGFLSMSPGFTITQAVGKTEQTRTPQYEVSITFANARCGRSNSEANYFIPRIWAAHERCD
jgi:hypothetical protein